MHASALTTAVASASDDDGVNIVVLLEVDPPPRLGVRGGAQSVRAFSHVSVVPAAVHSHLRTTPPRRVTALCRWLPQSDVWPPWKKRNESHAFGNVSKYGRSAFLNDSDVKQNDCDVHGVGEDGSGTSCVYQGFKKSLCKNWVRLRTEEAFHSCTIG